MTVGAARSPHSLTAPRLFVHVWLRDGLYKPASQPRRGSSARNQKAWIQRICAGEKYFHETVEAFNGQTAAVGAAWRGMSEPEARTVVVRNVLRRNKIYAA